MPSWKHMKFLGTLRFSGKSCYLVNQNSPQLFAHVRKKNVCTEKIFSITVIKRLFWHMRINSSYVSTDGMHILWHPWLNFISEKNEHNVLYASILPCNAYLFAGKRGYDGVRECVWKGECAKGWNWGRPYGSVIASSLMSIFIRITYLCNVSTYLCGYSCTNRFNEQVRANCIILCKEKYQNFLLKKKNAFVRVTKVNIMLHRHRCVFQNKQRFVKVCCSVSFGGWVA